MFVPQHRGAVRCRCSTVNAGNSTSDKRKLSRMCAEAQSREMIVAVTTQLSNLDPSFYYTMDNVWCCPGFQFRASLLTFLDYCSVPVVSCQCNRGQPIGRLCKSVLALSIFWPDARWRNYPRPHFFVTYRCTSTVEEHGGRHYESDYGKEGQVRRCECCRSAGAASVYGRAVAKTEQH